MTYRLTRYLTLFFVMAFLTIPSVVFTPNKAHAVAAPIVIIFDTSGSMNDNDKTGQVKLDTAKHFMRQFAQGQPTNQPMGLWTYPGGDSESGCAAGGWVPGLSPDLHPEKTEIDARIRDLSAGGDTPTGPALKAATDSLREMGFESATIVLVSDGESNCGGDPCQAAKEIIASGFDLSVAAVAFDIDTSSTGELECIAEATQGSFHTADSAEELLEEIKVLNANELELEVSAPRKVFAGESVFIEATITNPAIEPVNQITAHLVINDTALVPYVQAPRRRLPAIAAGESADVVWSVNTLSATSGEFDWRVYAGSNDVAPVGQSGSIKVTSEPLKREDGGELVQPKGGTVLVLGDSYSSGEGAGSYLTEGEPKCHRSYLTYGGVIGGDATEIIACSGVVSSQMYNGQHAGDKTQLRALREIVRDTAPDLVLLTVGGNDIDFAGVALSCFFSDCTQSRGAFLRNVATQAGWSNLYMDIAEVVNTPKQVKRRDGTLAPVLVSPYPDLLWNASRGHCAGVIETPVGSTGFGFTPAEVQVGKDVVSELNAKVQTSVEEARGSGYPVYFVDSVETMAAGHSICEKDSYFVQIPTINSAVSSAAEALKASLTGNDGPDRQSRDVAELLHPNRTGYQAWANAIITWSQRPNLEIVTEMPKDLSPFGSKAIEQMSYPLKKSKPQIVVDMGLPDPLGFFPSPFKEPLTLITGSPITVSVDGLLPGSTVVFVARSSSVAVGSAEVGDDGAAVATVTLPHLDSGTHTLVVSGYNEQFEHVGAEIPLKITGGIPWVFVPLGVLIMVAGGFLTWSWIKIRKTEGDTEAGET